MKGKEKRKRGSSQGEPLLSESEMSPVAEVGCLSEGIDTMSLEDDEDEEPVTRPVFTPVVKKRYNKIRQRRRQAKGKQSVGASNASARVRQAPSQSSGTSGAAVGSSSSEQSEDEDVAGPSTRASKRKREGEPTPPSVARALKRAKRMAYSLAVGGDLQVVIFPRDDRHRSLTAAEAVHIRGELVKLLDEAPDPVPRFSDSGLVKGAFRVTCADEASASWILGAALAVPGVNGEPAAYLAMRLKDMPVLKKASVFIPGAVVAHGLVLRRLQRQNPDLRTEVWKLLHQESRDTGQLLVLGVDAASREVLERLECRPYYELSRVQFRLSKTAQGAAK